ncbi:MAG: SusE domain-containing protein [Ferruginibacter sp.]
MKKIISQLFFPFLLAVVFISCKKDENKVFYEGGTNPVLSASATGPFVLDILQKNDPLLTFTWTNPDYHFTTGLSSQDINYTIQIDSAGKNFSSPGLAEIAVPNDLSKLITVGELNAKLLAMGIIENTTGDAEIRLKSAFSNGAGVLYSNIIKITATPYLDVIWPVPANLYITGSATPASWQCGCGEPELLSQKFTKVSSSKFELTIKLNGANSYLLLPVYGSWSHKYGGLGANNSNNVDGDNFKPEGGDLLSPPTTRIYKITVDFKTGKFKVDPA